MDHLKHIKKYYDSRSEILISHKGVEYFMVCKTFLCWVICPGEGSKRLSSAFLSGHCLCSWPLSVLCCLWLCVGPCTLGLHLSTHVQDTIWFPRLTQMLPPLWSFYDSCNIFKKNTWIPYYCIPRAPGLCLCRRNNHFLGCIIGTWQVDLYFVTLVELKLLFLRILCLELFQESKDHILLDIEGCCREQGRRLLLTSQLTWPL